MLFKYKPVPLFSAILMKLEVRQLFETAFYLIQHYFYIAQHFGCECGQEANT